jgi:hypothetical protein
MPTISITKTYRNGLVLLEDDLDNIIEDIENFLNLSAGGGIDDDILETPVSLPRLS